MPYRRIIAIFLVAVWSICILHCLSDNATAHWHVQTSGEPHHHHHPISGEHEHDNVNHGNDKHENGEPVDGHSHNNGVTQCCEVVASLASPLQLTKVVVFSHSYLLKSLIEPSQIVIGPEATRAEFFASSFEWDTFGQVQSLRVPNAPPSNDVF